MRRIFLWLFGSFCVHFRSPRPERILNAMHRANLPLWDVERKEDVISFRVFSFRQNNLLAFQKTLSAAEEMSLRLCGLPAYLKRYGKRYGFFAGIAIFAALTLLSTKLIWSVEISGAGERPEEVTDAFSQLGLRPGQSIRQVDPDQIALKFTVLHPEFSYAGIRLIGTRAVVELRLRDRVDQVDPYEGTSNLVASGSGRVVRCEVMAGETLVKPGDLVTKGALLVSGIRERENGAFHPVRARGKVFAETEEVLEEFIPLEEEKTVFTGREKRRYALSILGITIPLGSESSPFEEAESQIFTEPLHFLGRSLPILCRTTVYSEKEKKMTVITVDRALNLAYDRYNNFIRDSLPSETEILGEEQVLEEREDGVYLLVKFRCVRDLCQEVPFTLTSQMD